MNTATIALTTCIALYLALRLTLRVYFPPDTGWSLLAKFGDGCGDGRSPSPLPHLAIVGIRLVVEWQPVLLTVTHSEFIRLLDPESIVWIEISARKNGWSEGGARERRTSARCMRSPGRIPAEGPSS